MGIGPRKFHGDRFGSISCLECNFSNQRSGRQRSGYDHGHRLELYQFLGRSGQWDGPQHHFRQQLSVDCCPHVERCRFSRIDFHYRHDAGSRNVGSTHLHGDRSTSCAHAQQHLAEQRDGRWTRVYFDGQRRGLR